MLCFGGFNGLGLALRFWVDILRFRVGVGGFQLRGYGLGSVSVFRLYQDYIHIQVPPLFSRPPLFSLQ